MASTTRPRPARPTARHAPPGPLAHFLERVGAVDTSGCTSVERARLLAGSVMLLVVALLATASGALFAHDLMGLAVGWALMVGAFWGGIVLCLDRVIVLSLDNLRGPSRVATGVLRLAMAALLGWVVAEPFVLRVFDKEVRAELVAYAEIQNRERSAEIAGNPRYGDESIKRAAKTVADLRARSVSTGARPDAVNNDPEVVRLQAAHDAAAAARREQQAKVECESDGTCGTGRVGDGPEWQRKLDELRRLEALVDKLEGQLATARDSAASRLTAAGAADAGAATEDLAGAKETLATLTTERKAADEAARTAISGEDGLGARMDALARLRRSRPSIGLEYLLITGILIVVDTSAVAIKLLQRRPAEDRIRADEDAHRAELAEMVRRHDRLEREKELAFDAALQADLRNAINDHQREKTEAFLEEARRAADRREVDGDEDLSAHAGAEFGERLRRRAWPRTGS